MRLLILTDHSRHTSQNSVYALAPALQRHPLCTGVDIATRAAENNHGFFYRFNQPGVHAIPITDSFAFSRSGKAYRNDSRLVSLKDYDAILLRIPHPIPEGFWNFLSENYPEHQIINRPSGIAETSNKQFLLELADLCPPIQLCTQPEEVDSFRSRFPIVLKPLLSYGGQGIVKIDGNRAWIGQRPLPLSQFFRQWRQSPAPYLGMKYLSNVSQGDKRIVVANGQVLGAALRLPAPGAWMCNVAQGGLAMPAEPDADEWRIAERLTHTLSQKGIVLYGFDTLIDDNGRRILSEINTLSIGGLAQIGQFTGRPVIQQTADILMQYIKQNSHGHGRSALVA